VIAAAVALAAATTSRSLAGSAPGVAAHEPCAADAVTPAPVRLLVH
jgi:hypothetical protein